MMTALEAARLIAADYYGKHPLAIVDRVIAEGRCFTIVKVGDTLVGICRGTTDRAGWRVNLDFLHKPWPGLGEAGDEWHQGWLENAQHGIRLFRDRGLSLIVGHSKGAAEAQIAALTLGIDAITFAAPRPLWRAVGRRAAPVIINHNRSDDTVTHLPPRFLGYRHVGKVVWYRPRKRHWGEDHRIRHMLDLLEGRADYTTSEEVVP